MRNILGIWCLFIMIGLLPAQETEEEEYDDYLEFGEDAEGLTVAASPETTQHIEVIEKTDIEKRNAPDLATLLAEALDIGVTRYGAYGNQTEINIRGFDTERIAILIDGVPANSARSGEFDVSQIDLANVERIEVIYGGSDAKYNVSGALGGVINIITVKKQNPGLSITGSLANTGYGTGQYNRKGAVEGARYEDLVDTQSLNLSAGYGADKLSLRFNWFGTRAGNHYLYKDYYGFARRKQSNEVWDTGLAATVIGELPKSASLSSTTNLYFAHKQYPVTGVAEGYGVEQDFSFKETLLFNGPEIFREDLSTEASLNYGLNTMRYAALSEGRDHTVGGINRWHWYPTDALTVRAGIDWRFIAVSSTETTGKTGNLGGLYGAAEYYPIPSLLLTGSVKAATDAKQGVIVPKAGLSWQALDWFTLKNNYFRSFKFPDFDDLFYRSADGLYVGNPDLKPEDGWGADLTGGFKLKDLFEGSTTWYVQWTENSIHWVKHGMHWTPENVGTGFFFGFDLRPKVILPITSRFITKITVAGTYQFQMSWLLSEGLGFNDARRIPYMPMHIIGGAIDLQWGTGSFLASVHYESLRYADTGNNLELAPYWLLNCTINQDIGKNWTVFGVLRNALNELYTSFAEYPMPGVSCTIGVRYKGRFSLPTKSKEEPPMM
ncbi:MAG: TonB-dependent receptor [Treponema sp.]|jgi:vitamin B12 transporter|nr:TonB-dependent receptor [Treponema sp.]